MHKAILLLSESAEEVCGQISHKKPQLDIVFCLSGSVYRPIWEGVRIGKYSAKSNSIFVEIALIDSLVLTSQEVVVLALRGAIDRVLALHGKVLDGSFCKSVLMKIEAHAFGEKDYPSVPLVSVAKSHKDSSSEDEVQLILRWITGSENVIDSIIAAESELIEKLPFQHEVDGHEIGQGEVCIYINTKFPRSCRSATLYFTKQPPS